MRVLKAIVIFIMVSVFLVGFAICAFPFIQNIVMDNQLRQEAQDFFERLDPSTIPTDPAGTEESQPTDPTLPPREHEALWDDMVTQLEGFGWNDLVAFDTEKYQPVIDARKAAQ